MAMMDNFMTKEAQKLHLVILSCLASEERGNATKSETETDSVMNSTQLHLHLHLHTHRLRLHTTQLSFFPNRTE